MATHAIQFNDADRAILNALEDGRNLAANLEVDGRAIVSPISL